MIRNFKCYETQKLFYGKFIRKLPQSIQRVAFRKLKMLDAATNLDTLRVPPGNHLEALLGEQRGLYSIRINKQWRICFKWEQGDALDVEIVDYH